MEEASDQNLILKSPPPAYLVLLGKQIWQDIRDVSVKQQLLIASVTLLILTIMQIATGVIGATVASAALHAVIYTLAATYGLIILLSILRAPFLIHGKQRETIEGLNQSLRDKGRQLLELPAPLISPDQALLEKHKADIESMWKIVSAKDSALAERATQTAEQGAKIHTLEDQAGQLKVENERFKSYEWVHNIAYRQSRDIGSYVKLEQIKLVAQDLNKAVPKIALGFKISNESVFNVKLEIDKNARIGFLDHTFIYPIDIQYNHLDDAPHRSVDWIAVLQPLSKEEVELIKSNRDSINEKFVFDNFIIVINGRADQIPVQPKRLHIDNDLTIDKDSLAEIERVIQVQSPQKNSDGIAPAIKTLHDCFVSECKTTKMQSTYELSGNGPDGSVISYELEYQICTDFKSKTFYLSFFLPKKNYGFADILGAFAAVPMVYEELLKSISDGPHKQFMDQAVYHQPGEEPEKYSELKPSGRLYVYHEVQLSDEDVRKFSDGYKARGISPQFRGPHWLIMRNSPLYERGHSAT